MADILIIDDDRALCEMLSLNVKQMGHSVECAFSIEEGLKAARKGTWDVVFLDVRLPDGNGLEALPVIRSVRSRPEVIIFTGEGDPDGAQTAIERGAWDYVEKPTSVSAMMLPLLRAIEYRAAKDQEKVSLAKRTWPDCLFWPPPRMKMDGADLLLWGRAGAEPAGRDILQWLSPCCQTDPTGWQLRTPDCFMPLAALNER